MREYIIAGIGCIATIILLSIGVNLIFTKVDTINWNNGICTECDTGHYNFVNASDMYYYYQCDNCGHTERFYHNQ